MASRSRRCRSFAPFDSRAIQIEGLQHDAHAFLLVMFSDAISKAGQFPNYGAQCFSIQASNQYAELPIYFSLVIYIFRPIKLGSHWGKDGSIELFLMRANACLLRHGRQSPIESRGWELTGIWCCRGRVKPNWTGPQLNAQLMFAQTMGQGISLEKLQRAPVMLRLRQGGEMLRPHPNAARAL